MAGKEHYGSGILHSSPELVIRNSKGEAEFYFFEKTRNPQEFLRYSQEPFSYVESPHPDEIRSLQYIFTSIDKLYENIDPIRGQEVKSAFLVVLTTSPVQRLNRLSQLGKIKMPALIRQDTFLREIETCWVGDHLIPAANIQLKKNEYLGGKRFQHVLKVAEVVGRKILHMLPVKVGKYFYEQDRIPPEFAVNYLMAALLHDLGHPVMSHKGEMALTLALADENVRRHTHEGVIMLAERDHEKRALWIIDNSVIKYILEQNGFDINLIKEIIKEKQGSLQDADCAAYLTTDSINMPGDTSLVRLTDEDIEELVQTTAWDSKSGNETIIWRKKRPKDIRQKLLKVRRQAYHDIYRQPDITRMETQIALGLSMMVRNGDLNIEDLLFGDDETINQKAMAIARASGDKYKVFKDATDGILFPNVFVVPIESLNSELWSTIPLGLAAFQQKVAEILSIQELSTSLDADSWYAVLPYPYSHKRLKYGNGTIELNRSPDELETSVMFCFSSNMRSDVRDKLLRAISESAGIESERKWLFQTHDERVLTPFLEADHIGKFAIMSKEDLVQTDNYIWANEIGTPEESYLRLRHTYPKGSNGPDHKDKYKTSYKFALPRVREPGGLIHRGELEVDIPKEVYDELIQNPALIFNSSIPLVQRLVDRFRSDYHDVKIGSLGFVNNQRTKIILVHDGRQCELTVDRLVYTNLLPSYDWVKYIKKYKEFELEIEQKNMTDKDLQELLEYYITLALRYPNLLSSNVLSKLNRMRTAFRVDTQGDGINSLLTNLTIKQKSIY